MTSKQRFIAALERRLPDRLPVTTHHVMPFFLKNNMNGISNDEFFDYFGFDPIHWVIWYKPDTTKGEYFDPHHVPGYLEARRVVSDNWRIEQTIIPDPQYSTVRTISSHQRKHSRWFCRATNIPPGCPSVW
jgi:hypothetical protein